MKRYYIERTAQAVFTVFAVITITFGLTRWMPGGPREYIMAQLIQRNPRTFDPSDVEDLTAQYTNVNLDAPLHVQYYQYTTSVLQGDLGTSVISQREVADVLAEALPWTVFLMSTAMLLMFLIGVSLGAIMAYREGSRFDSSTTILATLLNSVPYYVAAIMLIWWLAYQINLFPPRGKVGSGVTPAEPVAFVLSVLHHGALPIISFVLTGFGGMALTMRGNSIQVLGEDYLRVARLRGLSERRIALRYVARNAILPMYTGLLITIGFLFGGSIVLEEIFGYPGVGFYLFRAIESKDFPLMLGGFLVVTIAVTVAVYVADLTYGLLDPTVETGGVSRYE